MNPFPTPRSVEHLLEILSSFTDYEKMDAFHSGKVRCDLDGMRRLADALGRPDRTVPCIHIAGSKGKGSTALMIAALASRSGIKCGVFTSPHLIRLEERIAVDGVPVSSERLLGAADCALEPLRRDPGLRPTFFEFITAAAMVVFSESAVDLAVYEVGLGGRLDATNVVKPVVSVIADIELEHTRRLGNTRAAIAREKAGIIKSGVPVVTLLDQDDPARRAVEERAAESGAPVLAPGAGLELIHEESGVRVSINGETTPRFAPPPPAALQARNCALALGAMSLAGGRPRAPDPAALESLVLPGRFEILSSEPRIIVDGAHSPRSLEAAVAEARRLAGDHRLVIVFGLARDKDLDKCVATLVSLSDELIAVRYDSSRSLDPAEILAAAGGIGKTADSVRAGLSLAREAAGATGTVLVTGSFYAAGEARAIIASR